MNIVFGIQMVLTQNNDAKLVLKMDIVQELIKLDLCLDIGDFQKNMKRFIDVNIQIFV